MMGVAKSLEDNLIFALHRPYFDLGKGFDSAPLNSWRPLLAYQTVEEENPYQLQRSMTENFRFRLIEESGLKQYAKLNPQEVPEEWRSYPWQQLCDWVQQFDSLAPSQQANVLYLLNTLCFYRLMLKLVPEQILSSLTTEAQRRMFFLRATAHYHLFNQSPGYQPTSFTDLLHHAPKESQTRHSIAMALMIHYAKFKNQRRVVRRFREIAEEFLSQPFHDRDSFEYRLLKSRFYRGASYLPFLEGNSQELTQEMDLAEELARSVQPRNFAETCIAKDNLYFVLESRMREAIWNGDFDLAEARLDEAILLDPWDSRSYIERGEIMIRRGRYEEASTQFLHAARIGPPGTALAFYMAGHCFEKLENHERAIDCYLKALRIDQNGISSVLALFGLAKRTNKLPLLNWVSERVEHFCQSGLLRLEEVAALTR